MKKQIFTAVASLAVVAAMSVSALAVAPGSTNGTATATTTVSKTEEATFTPVGVADAKVVASAGAFDVPDGSEVKIEMTVTDLKGNEAKQEEVKKEITEKLVTSATEQVTVTAVNTEIDISAYLDNAVIEPNGDVTITVAYDGASNKVAHMKDDGTVEILNLKVDNDTIASFTTKSFSSFYMVTVSEEATTPQPDETKPDPDKNQPTGVVLAVIPAAVAAAAVVVSKKRK